MARSRILRITPRAYSEDDAADYVALSVSTFRQYVAPLYPPVRLTPRRVGWLKEDLDAWLDKRAGRSPSLAAPPQANPWD